MKNIRKKIIAGFIIVVIICVTGGILILKDGPSMGILAYASEPAEELQEEVVTEQQTDPVIELPDVQISISSPTPWIKDAAKIQIQATDVGNTGNFSIVKAEARISEIGPWMDITSSMEVKIQENCSVYVRITDQNGQTYTHNRYIECYDQTKPTLSAAAKNGVMIIRGTDEESGVAAIYVNGTEFTELTESTLNVRLQKADTTYQYFTLQVRDQAGNMSDNYKVPNPYYENPDALNESYSGMDNSSVSVSLPSDVTPTEPTEATATVVEHEITGKDLVEEIMIEDTDTTSGRIQGTERIAADVGGKEFYTVQTKSGKVFYLIIDKDKADENVYLLTEVSENDLLNFTDNEMVTLPQNQAVVESVLPAVNTVPVEEETEYEVPVLPEPELEEPKVQKDTGTLAVMVIVLAGVVAAYYFLKKRKTSFDMDYDDDDEEEEEDTVYEEDEQE